MKYLILLCDGMADYKIEELDNQTPMETANKPTMNYLAKHGEVGLVKTVDDTLSPGSDVANLSVMGYDPLIYYSGRSPLEAASIGIDLGEKDIASRCNLVTLSDESCFEDKIMMDYCAGDISTKEAEELIKFLQEKLGDEKFEFYSGISYRHCLVYRNAEKDVGKQTPPHDISERKVGEYLPEFKNFEILMRKSYDLLKDHPVNLKRIKEGKHPANCIWLWGSGYKKPLQSFTDKTGLKGTMISAVDLLKGIGKLAKMNVVEVEGATGYIDTNFEGKKDAAIKAFDNSDFVYLHIEAPDECGHRHEIQNKIKAIEIIDEKVLTPLVKELNKYDNYKIMILPDHATPLALKTHTRDAVPYLIYEKNKEQKNNIDNFCEETAKTTGIYVDRGCKMLNKFLEM